MEEVEVLLATSNPGKVKEINAILAPYGIRVKLPEEKVEVEEKGTTFLENAYLKAKAYWERFRLPTVADDSGLVVEALGGYPGIYSSRFYSIDFGGIEEGYTPDEANIRKVLRLLEGKENRRAKFVACALFYDGGEGLFAFGECKGEITLKPEGGGGFGYDPVFRPDGYEVTMAQLSAEEKNRISHRGKAFRRLARLIRRVYREPSPSP